VGINNWRCWLIDEKVGIPYIYAVVVELPMDDAWPVEPDDAIEEPLDDPIELDGIAVVEPVGAAQVHVQGVEPIEAVDPIDPIETSGLVAPVPSVGIVYGATVDGILV